MLNLWTSRASSCLGLLAVCACAGFAAAAPGWQVVLLHPAGAASSTANGASASVQVGSAVFAGVRHAGLWRGTPGSWQDINPTFCGESDAYAISGSEIVGRATLGATGRGCAWDTSVQPVASSWVDLFPGWPMSMATATGDGQRVGWGVITDPAYAEHACLWDGSESALIDLHPAGAEASYAMCVGGGVQGGVARINGFSNACIWRGSAASFTNLNPPGRFYSEIRAMFASVQVGFVVVGSDHASIWHGTPESWTDIHPLNPDVVASELFGTAGDVQVGTAWVRTLTPEPVRHASIWKGTSESWADLHQMLGPQYWESEATGVWAGANGSLAISGYAHNGPLNRDEAVAWLFEPPPPCLADFNGDGFVSFSDFDAFVLAFEAGLASADTNADTFLTFEDFDVFVVAFEAGC